MCYQIIAMAVVAGLQIYQGIQQGKAAEEQGKYNAAVAENNAKVAEVQARDERLLGAQEQQKAEWRKRATIATQRASAATANVDLSQGFGSGLDIIEDTALLAGAEKNSIMMDAMRKAWGFDVQATNYRAQAKLDKWSGKAQKKASFLGGLTQAAGTVASSMGGGG